MIFNFRLHHSNHISSFHQYPEREALSYRSINYFNIHIWIICLSWRNNSSDYPNMLNLQKPVCVQAHKNTNQQFIRLDTSIKINNLTEFFLHREFCIIFSDFHTNIFLDDRYTSIKINNLTEIYLHRELNTPHIRIIFFLVFIHCQYISMTCNQHYKILMMLYNRVLAD